MNFETDDSVAQQQAEDQSASTDAARAYRNLFDAISAMPIPEPDSVSMQRVRAAVADTQRHQQRERLWVQGLLAALIALFIAAVGVSVVNLAGMMSDVPILYPFSALTIVVVGLLTNRLEATQ